MESEITYGDIDVRVRREGVVVQRKRVIGGHGGCTAFSFGASKSDTLAFPSSHSLGLGLGWYIYIYFWINFSRTNDMSYHWLTDRHEGCKRLKGANRALNDMSSRRSLVDRPNIWSTTRPSNPCLHLIQPQSNKRTAWPRCSPCMWLSPDSIQPTPTQLDDP